MTDPKSPERITNLRGVVELAQTKTVPKYYREALETLEALVSAQEALKKDLLRAFSLDDDQRKDIHTWMTTHNEEKHGGKARYDGAIGGGFTYLFTPTGVGDILVVRCGLCDGDDGKKDFSWYTYEKNQLKHPCLT